MYSKGAEIGPPKLKTIALVFSKTVYTRDETIKSMELVDLLQFSHSINPRPVSGAAFLSFGPRLADLDSQFNSVVWKVRDEWFIFCHRGRVNGAFCGVFRWCFI